MPLSSTVTEEQFARIRERFLELSVGLSDLQLLELADCYHEIRRSRRDRRGGGLGLEERRAF